MIKLNSNIKHLSARLFLSTFVVFLVLQFNHAHTISLKFNQNSAFSSEQKNTLDDPFLDSSLNCTLHSFNNSLSYQNIIDSNFGILKLTSNLFETLQFSYISILFNSNQLRAPPKILA